MPSQHLGDLSVKTAIVIGLTSGICIFGTMLWSCHEKAKTEHSTALLIDELELQIIERGGKGIQYQDLAQKQKEVIRKQFGKAVAVKLIGKEFSLLHPNWSVKFQIERVLARTTEIYLLNRRDVYGIYVEKSSNLVPRK